MSPRPAIGVILLGMLSVATAAPVETTDVNTVRPQTVDCNNDTSDADVYDQRQNGTENYRIHVNGVVVLVAPADAVLQAAQLGTLQMGSESEGVSSGTQHPLKPKPKPPTATDKVPNDSHVAETATAVHLPKEKSNLKLLNLLHMFRSMRHDSEGHK